MKKIVHAFFSNGTSWHSFFVIKDEKVFGFGYNGYGQLGLGDNRDRTVPSLIPHLSPFAKTYYGRIKKILMSFENSYVLTHSGTILVSGSNVRGQRGLGKKDIPNNYLFKPILMTNNHKKEILGTVKNIFCGEDRVYFITSKKNMYGFGRNSCGSLGCGDSNDKYLPAKVFLPENEKFVSISGGLQYTVFLNSKGVAYECGFAHVDTGRNVIIPIKIQFPFNEKVKIAICGYAFSLFLTENNMLYGKGNNGSGQLGHNPQSSTTEVKKLHLLKYFSNIIIKDVKCGHSHSLVLTSDNVLYGFGANSDGQLGISTAVDVKTPKLIRKGVCEIFPGSFNSFFLDKYSNLYASGYNSRGSLGVGRNGNNTRFSESSSSFLLSVDTNVYVIRKDIVGKAVDDAFFKNIVRIRDNGKYCDVIILNKV